MGKVTRRDFIVKGGKYTLFTASAMQVLFTSKQAMAQSGLAQFVVDVGAPDGQPTFSGPPSRSPSGTWNGSQFITVYNEYTIAFEGETGHLPPTVPVTVTWNGDSFSSTGAAGMFYWDDSTGTSGTHTFSVPKAAGLTIGSGSGTVGHTVPFVLNQNTTQQTGTVSFSASGVQSLVIAVVMPGHPIP